MADRSVGSTSNDALRPAQVSRATVTEPSEVLGLLGSCTGATSVQDPSCPPEVNSLGRTLIRWRDQIAAWHRGRVTNGPTEAANNLIKRITFGFRRFRNYRIRTLLYAGKPNWRLLATFTPRRNPKCR